MEFPCEVLTFVFKVFPNREKMVARGWRHGKMQVLGSIHEKRADAPIASARLMDISCFLGNS
jgi:hypothetical protein